MPVALDGQQAAPGAQHGPKPISLHHAGVRQKGSCEWAQRAGFVQATVSSALPGSAATIGCFSHQPDAPICQPPSSASGQGGRGGRAKPPPSRRWSAVMTLKHVGLRADGVVASHRAADGAGPSIEGARTCAHATSRGAAAAVSRVRSAIGTEAELDEPLTSPTKRPRAAPGGFLLAQWYAMLQV